MAGVLLPATERLPFSPFAGRRQAKLRLRRGFSRVALARDVTPYTVFGRREMIYVFCTTNQTSNAKRQTLNVER
jgi:hypothetical protein